MKAAKQKAKKKAYVDERESEERGDGWRGGEAKEDGEENDDEPFFLLGIQTISNVHLDRHDV